MTTNIESEHLLDYVRGNLAPDMCEKVERACQEDKSLAEELAYYNGLTVALSKDRLASHELQWEKLSRAIDDVDAPLVPLTPANDTGRVWRWAACALGALLIGQTVFMSTNLGQTNNDSPVYLPAAQTVDANSLQVSFVPLATEVSIRSLLLDVDAKIVEGPSALGIYILSFETKESQETALGIMSEKSNIVESVTEN